MYVKRLSSNEFDLWWGNGWNNWARLTIDGKKVVQVKGERIPAQVFVAFSRKYAHV